MKETQEYADQWNVSAKHFYDKGYYSWMAQAIDGLHTVIEIGCGTGYSTLAVVEKRHKVIAIDKNPDCIKKAKELLSGSNPVPIADVAELVGCGNNPMYFSQIFKKGTGMSPSSYVKMIQKPQS